jgi:hypothetical protein
MPKEKNAALTAEIQTARADFEALNDDLTKIQELARTNAATYENLKTGNAPLQHRLEARTHMLAAEDLVLEQQRAVNQAKATLDSLENALQRETAWAATIEALTPPARETQNAWNDWQATLKGLPSTVRTILASFVDSRNEYISAQAELERALAAHGQTLSSVANDLQSKSINLQALKQPLPFHGTVLAPGKLWELTTRFDDVSGTVWQLVSEAIRHNATLKENAAREKRTPQMPQSVDLDLNEFPVVIAGKDVDAGDLLLMGDSSAPWVALCRVRHTSEPHLTFLRVAELKSFTSEQQNNHQARAEACKTFAGKTEVIMARFVSELHTGDTVRNSRSLNGPNAVIVSIF